jgi:hypothetical protein|tara:strand:+ start:103 stop:402 length:300 start_codon:yes stop_codon:yes gene_type:complete
LKSKERRKLMEQKATQKERVSKKYGALISYYTEVWALAYNTVSSHPVLSTLDPMGKKTTTTTLFLRACSRMDKSDEQSAKAKAEVLETISNSAEERKAV